MNVFLAFLSAHTVPAPWYNFNWEKRCVTSIQCDRPQKDHRLFKILNGDVKWAVEALSGKKKKAGNDFEMGEMGTLQTSQHTDIKIFWEYFDGT